MNKVIAINLNGNAFALDEPGYEVLRAYLERAAMQLRDNPDKGEILADLEQAIAEKCGSYLRPHKNVVTSSEVEQIVKDMGPVDDGREPNSGEAAGNAAAAGAAAPSGPAVKRLYQIREGAMISGICNGLAAYFNIDVSFVRIGAVLLAFLSGGIVALVYLLMMFVIPVANTTEQRAAAHGAPFNAQELIDRAKKQYSEFKDNQEWKQHWKRQRQQWREQRHEWKKHFRNQAYSWGDQMHRNMGQMVQGTAYGASYGARILAGVMVPLLGIASAGLFLALVLTIISLATTSALFGWPLPAGLPLWLGIVLVVVLYNFFVWPLHALRRASYYAVGGHGYGWFAAWDGLLRFAVVAFALWFGYEHVPQVKDFVDHLPQLMQNFWLRVRQPETVSHAGT